MGSGFGFWGAVIGGIVGGPAGAVLGGILGSTVNEDQQTQTGNEEVVFENSNSQEGSIQECFVDHGQFINGIRGMKVTLKCMYKLQSSIFSRSEKFVVLCLFFNKKGKLLSSLYPEFAMENGGAVFASEEVVNSGISGVNSESSFSSAIFIPYGVLKVKTRREKEILPLVIRTILFRDSDKTTLSVQHYSVEYFIYGNDSRESTPTHEAEDPNAFPFVETLFFMGYICHASSKGHHQNEESLVASFYLPENETNNRQPLLNEFHGIVNSISSSTNAQLNDAIVKSSQVIQRKLSLQARLDFVAFLAALASADYTTNNEELSRLKSVCSALNIPESYQEKIFSSLFLNLDLTALFIIDLFSLVINLDNYVAAEEIRVVKKFFSSVFQDDPKKIDSIKEFLKQSLKRKINLDEVKTHLNSALNVDVRENILFNCILICISDGQLSVDENHLISKIGNALEIQTSKIEEMKSSISSSFNELFSLLGVKPGASLEDIKRAFKEKAKTMHPDKLAGMDPEIQKFATAKFQKLQEAYEILVKMYE